MAGMQESRLCTIARAARYMRASERPDPPARAPNRKTEKCSRLKSPARSRSGPITTFRVVSLVERGARRASPPGATPAPPRRRCAASPTSSSPTSASTAARSPRVAEDLARAEPDRAQAAARRSTSVVQSSIRTVSCEPIAPGAVDGRHARAPAAPGCPTGSRRRPARGAPRARGASRRSGPARMLAKMRS